MSFSLGLVVVKEIQPNQTRSEIQGKNTGLAVRICDGIRPRGQSLGGIGFRGAALLSGAPSTVAAVPDRTPGSFWLVDPIREHCRRFWRINGLRQGMVDDVPCN